MNTRFGLWLKRSRSERGLLLVTAAAIAVVTIVLSAIVGLATRTPVTAIRDTLASTPFASSSAVLGMDLATQPTAQDAAVASLLSSRFGGAPLLTERTVVSDPWPLADGSPGTSPTTDSPTVVFIDDDSAVRGRVRAVAGSVALPQGAGSAQGAVDTVAIDSTGATALRVGVGDSIRLQLDSRILTVRVAGIFAPREPSQLAWVSASAGVDGSSARLLASSAVLASLGSATTVRYAVAPRAAAAHPADLDGYSHGFRTLAAAAEKKPGLAGLSPTVTGDANVTITAMQDSLRATSAVIPVPIAVLAVSSLIALILLAQLVAASRENETRLLRARGASLGTLVRVSAVESAVISALGVVVGVIVAQVGLGIAVGPSTSGIDAVVPALATFVVAVACSVGVSFRAVLRASGAPRPESGRARAAGSASLAILLLAAAAVTTWRFLSAGTPAPGQPADPVGIFAPAAALCALAMLGLVLLGPLARWVEGLANRTTGVGAVLPARQIGRSLGLFAAPVALLVLAVGASSFAATYVGTWSTFLAGTARLVNGSDVAVAVENAPVVGSDPEAVDKAGYRSIAGVSATAPVLSTGAQVGDQTVTLIAVAASRLPSLVSVDSRMLDAAALQRMLLAGAPTGAASGLALPGSATAVTLDLAATQATEVVGATIAPTLWIEDPAGDLVPLSLPAVPITSTAKSTPTAVSARIPSGGPWRTVALDLGVTTTATLTKVDAMVSKVSATVGSTAVPVALAGADWQPESQVFGLAANRRASGDYLGRVVIPSVTGGALGAAVRLMPKGDGVVPVVIGREMAGVLGLHVGDPVQFDGDWSGFSARVTGILPVVPGAADQLAAIADLPALQSGALRTSSQSAALNTVWLAASDPSSVQEAVGRVAGPTATVTAASGALSARFLVSAVIGLWMGAFGCAAFALVALAGAIGATARRRAGEVVVLRAIGMSARQQGAERRSEIVVITVYALICGLVSGALVSLIAASSLARLSVSFAPRVLPVPIGVDVSTLAIALAGLVAAVIVVTAWFVRSVRHRAAEPAVRGGA